MKSIFMLSIALLSFGTNAQPTNAEPKRATPPKAAQPAHPPPLPALSPEELKPGELIVGNHTCSGIAVQAFKTRSPLQLVNPLAPPEYGRAEDSLLRDPITGRPSGWKLFAIRF